MRRLVPLAAALAALAFVVATAQAGDPAPAAPAPGSLPAPGVVSGEVARELVAGGAKVVDVRTPQEFAAAHVPGAINVPFDELPARAGELGPADGAIVLYCRSGRRSGIARQTLDQLGFTRIYDFQRLTDWPGEAAGGAAAGAQ